MGLQLERTIKERLCHEHRVLEEGMERVKVRITVQQIFFGQPFLMPSTFILAINCLATPSP